MLFSPPPEPPAIRRRRRPKPCAVTAPRDGTIVYVTDWRGEKSKVGDNVWKAKRIIEIPDLTRMKAEGEVDEVDAGRVAVGQRVSLRVSTRIRTKSCAARSSPRAGRCRRRRGRRIR